MRIFRPFVLLAAISLFSAFLTSCEEATTEEKAQAIIEQAIAANGAHLFPTKKVAFDFRGRRYSAQRQDGDFVYTRSFQDSLGWVEDRLVNSTAFSRTIDGQLVNLTTEWQGRYGNSVNSVLYFVEILYRLNDAAVNKTYEGLQSIKGENYHTIKVTFDQEDGGKDFQDEFLYWLKEDNFTLDYVAYNYETDGGGVRFREAYGREVIGGITFQNYVNYKPDSKATPLEELPSLFEAGKLKELSKIVNTGIVVE
ncbi:MAG: DUF6503 family protein [Bacteroidota bacterium]